MGFLSLNCPFFLVLLQILIFNRSYSSFRADFYFYLRDFVAV